MPYQIASFLIILMTSKVVYLLHAFSDAIFVHLCSRLQWARFQLKRASRGPSATLSFLLHAAAIMT